MPEAKLRIVKLEYPSQAKPGETVRISCRYHNEGDYGKSFCGFWDADTDDYLGGGGTHVHPPCVIGGFGIGRPMPNRDWRIRAEVGADTSNPRDPARVVQDSREITIRLLLPAPIEWVPIPLAVGLSPIIGVLSIVATNEVQKLR